VVCGEEEEGNRGRFIGLDLKMKGNEGRRGERVCGETERKGGGRTCVGMKKRRKNKGVDVLFGQLRGNLVREKKGRVSARGGGPCVRQLGVAEGFLGWQLFFFQRRV
jgi:hypothetical protein